MVVDECHRQEWAMNDDQTGTETAGVVDGRIGPIAAVWSPRTDRATSRETCGVVVEVTAHDRRLLDRDTQRYRSLDELRELVAPALAARQVVSYCGAGVAATSDACALHRV
jgi:hypothetical protein